MKFKKVLAAFLAAAMVVTSGGFSNVAYAALPAETSLTNTDYAGWSVVITDNVGESETDSADAKADNTIVWNGGAITFTANLRDANKDVHNAVSGGELSYQWYAAGSTTPASAVKITGATDATYTVEASDISEAGSVMYVWVTVTLKVGDKTYVFNSPDKGNDGYGYYKVTKIGVSPRDIISSVKDLQITDFAGVTVLGDDKKPITDPQTRYMKLLTNKLEELSGVSGKWTVDAGSASKIDAEGAVDDNKLEAVTLVYTYNDGYCTSESYKAADATADGVTDNPSATKPNFTFNTDITFVRKDAGNVVWPAALKELKVGESYGTTGTGKKEGTDYITLTEKYATKVFKSDDSDVANKLIAEEFLNVSGLSTAYGKYTIENTEGIKVEDIVNGLAADPVVPKKVKVKFTLNHYDYRVKDTGSTWKIDASGNYYIEKEYQVIISKGTLTNDELYGVDSKKKSNLGNVKTEVGFGSTGEDVFNLFSACTSTNLDSIAISEGKDTTTYATGNTDTLTVGTHSLTLTPKLASTVENYYTASPYNFTLTVTQPTLSVELTAAAGSTVKNPFLSSNDITLTEKLKLAGVADGKANDYLGYFQMPQNGQINWFIGSTVIKEDTDSLKAAALAGTAATSAYTIPKDGSYEVGTHKYSVKVPVEKNTSITDTAVTAVLDKLLPTNESKTLTSEIDIVITGMTVATPARGSTSATLTYGKLASVTTTEKTLTSAVTVKTDKDITYTYTVNGTDTVAKKDIDTGIKDAALSGTSISYTIPSDINAGSYEYTFTVNATKNGTVVDTVTSAPVAVTIAKQPIEDLVPTAETFTYGEKTLGAVSFTSGNENVTFANNTADSAALKANKDKPVIVAGSDVAVKATVNSNYTLTNNATSKWEQVGTTDTYTWTADGINGISVKANPATLTIKAKDQSINVKENTIGTLGKTNYEATGLIPADNTTSGAGRVTDSKYALDTILTDYSLSEEYYYKSDYNYAKNHPYKAGETDESGVTRAADASPVNTTYLATGEYVIYTTATNASKKVTAEGPAPAHADEVGNYKLVVQTATLTVGSRSTALTVDREFTITSADLNADGNYELTVDVGADDCNDVISFVSSAADVLTVAAKDGEVQGKTRTMIITPRKNGTATVTTSISGQTADSAVTVILTNEISAEDVVVEVNKTSTIKVEALPAGARLTAAAGTYKSADEKIATVNADGVVTGVAQGTTTITVTKDGFTKEIGVTVFDMNNKFSENEVKEAADKAAAEALKSASSEALKEAGLSTAEEVEAARKAAAEEAAADAKTDALKNATAEELKAAGLSTAAEVAAAEKTAAANATRGMYTKAQYDAAVKKASSGTTTKTVTRTKAVDKKGAAIIVGKNIYKITNVSKKTAEFTGTISTGKSVSVAATVKSANKVTYKVTSIAANALKGNKTITKLTIGKNVTSIGKKALNGCKKLKTITIASKSIRTVGAKAFKGVSAKAKVKVPSAKVKAYKKLFQKAGLGKKAKVTK